MTSRTKSGASARRCDHAESPDATHAAWKPGPAGGAVENAAGVRSLNPLDSIMLAVNQELRSRELPGFETQTLVWLDGRPELDRLRSAISRLSARYPIITSRLLEGRFRGCRWQPRPGAVAPLLEHTLQSGDRAAVLDQAARILSRPRDVRANDPIQFHVLHLLGGRDVFLMQYNHVLMDNNAAVLVLRELDRLSEASVDPPRPELPQSEDLMAEYRRRFSLGRRLRAAWRTASLRLRELGFRPVVLGGFDRAETETSRFRIVSRSLAPEQTRALLAHTIESCRFPSVSMAALASAFRGIGKLTHAPDAGRGRYIAGIGIDLGLRAEGGPIFQNLVSMVPISAGPEDLADRTVLTRKLNQQLRDRLARDLDLGLLELAGLFRVLRPLFRKSIGRVLRNGYSLWYGYFGSSDAAGDRFCGTPISDLLYTGPCWPPIGVTLLINQFRGRTSFQMTYLPSRVPESLAIQLLDAIIEDLTAGLRRDRPSAQADILHTLPVRPAKALHRPAAAVSDAAQTNNGGES